MTKSRVTRPEMLRREVEILKTVKHPNIVEIVAVYDEPNYLHIVSELCTGGELFDAVLDAGQYNEKVHGPLSHGAAFRPATHIFEFESAFLHQQMRFRR